MDVRKTSRVLTRALVNGSYNGGTKGSHRLLCFIIVLFLCIQIWFKLNGEIPLLGNAPKTLSLKGEDCGTKNLECDCDVQGDVKKGIVEQKKEYLRAFRQYPGRLLGISDVELLLPTLALLRGRHGNVQMRQEYRIAIDVGANIGRMSSRMLNFLTEQSCRNVIPKPGKAISWHESCIRFEQDVVVFAFEPISKTFGILETNAKRQGWMAYPYVATQTAVTDHTGEIVFFTTGKDGDEQASQDVLAATVQNRIHPQKVTIPALTVDSLYKDGFPKSVNQFGHEKLLLEYKGSPIPESTKIFLLKIDAEGYDMNVLEGAKASLKEQRIKFVSFEYNNKWFTAGRTKTLKIVVAELFDLHYHCYWITPNELIPLFDAYWHDEYEIKYWSNVFCGRSEDPDVEWVVRSYKADL
eukprot:Nk52_evm13s684 gene=Nk52_evmTU13s684